MQSPEMSRLFPTAARRPSLAVVLLLTLGVSLPAAEKKSPAPSDDAAIRATADAFVKAFNRGDAKAVAALWTTSGTMADDRGQILKGRKAIEDEYAALFKAHPGVQMQVAVQSIDFPAPGTAVEDGIATVAPLRGAPPTASRYSAVHVLQDGKWLMASVRETQIDHPSHYARLQGLEWLVGKWEIKTGDTAARNDIRWIANKSFLQREYTVRRGGIVASSGTQIIGWDPQSGKIKSWSFDSAGGHGSGLWTATPDGWQIDSAGFLADGTPTASRDFVIRVAGEDNVFGWRSVGRKVGLESLPDTAEVVLDRVPEKK